MDQNKKQFKEWLKTICRWENTELFVEWEGEEGAPKAWGCRVAIYSHTYKYTIRVKIDINHTYLGCGVSCRAPRAGETWTRGNDLSDGPFRQDTWNKITNDIVRHELVKISKYVRNKDERERDLLIDG